MTLYFNSFINLLLVLCSEAFINEVPREQTGSYGTYNFQRDLGMLCDFPCLLQNGTTLNVQNYMCEQSHATLDKVQDNAEACRNLGFEEINQTRTIREAMLQAHNSIRNRIAASRFIGPVANMNYLAWNYDLEKMARIRLADCEDKPTVCPMIFYQGNVVQVGENHLTIYSPIFPEHFAAEIVRRWYFEARKISKRDLLDGLRPNFGNSFTQLAWSLTRQIGCAANRFTNGTKGYRMLCYYVPAGNIIGEPVIQQGKICTNCDNVSCNKMYTGLCGRESNLYGLNKQSVMNIDLSLIIFILYIDIMSLFFL